MYETYRWEFSPEEIHLVIRRLKHSTRQKAADHERSSRIPPDFLAELRRRNPDNEEWDAAMDLLAETDGPIQAAWETKDWALEREASIKRNQALLALLRIITKQLERTIEGFNNNDE
jgi:hypothetical protein